ncbi:hypothetical protein [Larkinella soli]|uniref:hypothetical protein n=1 Tax=Larkinella soli TaxID=1770527 RepID=UPI000FFC7CFA|nr:hypothetical protein [Larkinella soli]
MNPATPHESPSWAANLIFYEVRDKLPGAETMDELTAESWVTYLTSRNFAFSLQCRYKPLHGFDLVRLAWKYAQTFCDSHLPTANAETRLLFYSAITRNLLLMVNASTGVKDANYCWFLAFEYGFLRISYCLN